MKCVLRKDSCLLVLLYGISQSLSAQSNASRFEVGLHAGANIYQGDLTPSSIGSFKTPALGMGLFGSMKLSSSFSLRANFDFGRLKGNDAKYSNPDWRKERNLKFNTSYKEVAALVVWDILGKNNESIRYGLSPYMFAGVGYSSLKIRRDYSNFNADYFSSAPTVLNGLSADIAHTAPKGAFVLPVGIGVRYALSPSLSIKAETSYRFTNTDYLDGFSEVANPSQKDSYYSNSIGLIFSIGKRSRLSCPVLKH
jgi:opacity protein-like surface antigen